MGRCEVKILQTGYCLPSENDSDFTADCTVSLIIGDFSPILVDTSGPWNTQKLLQDLRSSGFEKEDIKTVVCTHGHSDHVGNLNLFSAAKFIVGYDVFCGNVYESFDFKSPGAKYQLTSDVYVIPTPGHTNADVSVVVNGTNIGTVVIAGDAFENERDFDEPEQWMSLSENKEAQLRSRNKIISVADHIIPGHGKMFPVTESMRNSAHRTCQ